MSRKERVVAAIGPAIAAGGAQARRGLARRLLAGVFLAVAVAGAVLIPRLLVGLSPRHELGVAAPGTAAPPVVLAPGLHAQKTQPRAAAGAQSQATRIGVVPSSSTSQPKTQARPATSPVALRPPAAQSRPAAQPEPQPESQPTLHALTPTPPASGTTTCDCAPTRGAATASRRTTAKLRVTPPPHPHPTANPKLPKLPKPPKTHDKPRPHTDDPQQQHTPAPEPGQEAEPPGHGNGHKP